MTVYSQLDIFQDFSFTVIMVDYNNLKNLARTRLAEAKILCQNGYYDGAIYLCGYVVEISLKARICKHLRMPAYPADTNDQHKNIFACHDFDRLLLLSGLTTQISLSGNRNLFNNWSLVTTWKPERRYGTIGTTSQQEAEEMIRALDEPAFGFFTWIKRRW